MGYFAKDAFKSDICVVTGGSGALGKEIVSQCVSLGAKVAILDTNEKLPNENALFIKCDVLNQQEVKNALKEIKKKLGVPTALVNCAGGNDSSATTDQEFYQEDQKGRSFFDLEIASLEKNFNLNYFGTLIPTQLFASEMVKANKGSIVNFASVSSFNPLTKVVSYSSAKAAIVNFTKWLAIHLSKTDVRVNAVAPGFVMTEQLKFLHLDKEGNLTKRAKKVVEHTPLGRYGSSDEIVGAVLYLISDLSKFVTGSILSVDGGFSSYTI
ncbi:MAG: SDR family oxidoreductase [Sphaerochaetaceae bacterium]|jgi:NAD(P)-dependent dehydrogenase (short-subunit alcohol dehydrogenase family)